MSDAEEPIRVILVDDEEDFLIPVTRYLGKRGMEAQGVGSVEDLLVTLEGADPDVIVLDINLPGESGLQVLDRLRELCRAGVILATARRGVDDRIHGISLGADAYLEKPLDLRELEVVIRALHRRLSPRPSAPDPSAWRFDPEAWTLSAPDGLDVRLSGAEYAVVEILFQQMGKPVSREALFEKLGKPPPDPEDRAVDVLLSRLRRKFADSRHSLPLRSVRGVGYVFSASPRA